MERLWKRIESHKYPFIELLNILSQHCNAEPLFLSANVNQAFDYDAISQFINKFMSEEISLRRIGNPNSIGVSTDEESQLTW